MENHVEIRLIDNLKGNGLFAKKDFPKGSILFEESPLVCAQFSWNSAYGYKACDYCLRPLETAEENFHRLSKKYEILLPHLECCTTDKSKICSCESCGIEFCSLTCKEQSFKEYHQFLCEQWSQCDSPLQQLNETWKQMHYPPETSTVMIIPRMLAKILSNNEVLSELLEFCHHSKNDESDLVHKFLGPKFSEQITVLHGLLINSIPNVGIEQLLTLEGFQSLIALIGTNGQGVGTSPVSRWVTAVSDLPLHQKEKEDLDAFIDRLYEDMEEESGMFLNNEGVALYKLQSKCNHSCSPNAEASFLNNNNCLSMVALRDIRMGEEICISYIDECTLNRSRHSRLKELKENYLFICNCERCESQIDQPDITSDEDEEEMSE